MMEYAFTLFDTAIGRCGIAWSGCGIACLQLPEADDAATRARVLKRCPDAREAPPPPGVARAIEGIAALMRGEAIDLSAVALDMDGVPPFCRRVYEAARMIAPGATLTYGDIAARLGDPAAARAVGQALGQNPFAIIVPCHRVVAAGRKSGGFSAHGGVTAKRRLLAIEGAQANPGPTLFDRDGGLRFDPDPVDRDRRRNRTAGQADPKQYRASRR
jgi:methylated-DNA-[protein]-cysteine S-methyltransferase